MIRSVTACCLVAITLIGCKESEECERMRLGLSKTYGTLRESAGKRKLAGVDVDGWTAVEEKVALLESSFMTPQVTWQSAEKAKSELGAKVGGLQTDNEGNLRGYRLSVEAAVKEQEAFTAKCH